jgi:tetratricopeptide (TPR) repeat protein
MAHDGLGNEISARDARTIAAIGDFVGGFLGYERRIAHILGAADADPDPLANAYAGLLWMLSETGGVPPDALRYLARAENTACLPREAQIVAILRAWIDDDVPLALRLIEQALHAWPRDLVLLKLHQYHDFVAGDFPAMLRVALACRQAAADIPYFHGMLAFAYEQMHLLEQAEAAARTALSMQRREPWAQHALAHVMLTKGRIDEGAEFLESMRDTWVGLTSFMYTHAWWHLALFYLSQGRNAEALAAYDDHCWSREKDFSQDQVGAVSLLARFDFAGIDVGARWGELGAHLAARTTDVSQPFLTLQYFYGLARAHRVEAAALLAAIHAAPHSAPRATRMVWREIGVPLADGLAAAVAGDAEAGVRLLMPMMPRLAEIGGSHAQRDLFDQILLQCLIDARHDRAAQQILEQRRRCDPDGKPVNRALATVYGRLGLNELAEEARKKFFFEKKNLKTFNS